MSRATSDSRKDEGNIRERKLPFELAAEFDFDRAHILADIRHDYGETRFIALGELHQRLQVLCFTETPDGIRVIRFRKANDREIKRRAKVQALD